MIDLQSMQSLFAVIGKQVSDSQDWIPALLSSKRVLIYGAGAGGNYTQYLLSLINCNVFAFLDMNAKNVNRVNGVPVYLPSEVLMSDQEKRDTFIIIAVGSVTAKAEIEQMLSDNGYSHIKSYIELFNEVFLMADHNLARNTGSDFYIENKEDILKAFELLADQESKDILYGFVKGHALKDKESFMFPNLASKYFPGNIQFSKGYRCFVDCGASRGETYSALEKNEIFPETVIMFEPDRINFSILSATMKEKRQKAFLYPCAVYSKTGVYEFEHTGTQGSSMSSRSADSVQCVTIDESLLHFNPTFIKMDIEGGEYDALVGTKETLIQNKPDIAVCVYHAVNHIWDIPLLLDGLGLDYKFYLRSSNLYGMNTVLYAVESK